MNNNRGGNNRRRGRGNNNPRPQGSSGGGGGQQVNRIDSRARGNAPQMLEKYRKLANDAHLNGDRVNAEYNLQFADHYFRVIADTRIRQEEQRLRRDDRWQEGGENASEENDENGEFGVESEFPAFDQPPVYTRRDREDRPERSPERTPERVPERTSERVVAERGQDRVQPQSGYRRRDERPANDGQTVEPSQPQTADQSAPITQGWSGNATDASGNQTEPDEKITAYEPPENPFLRENRGGRGLRPRREDRRPRRENAAVPTQDVPDTETLGEAQSLPAENQAALGETRETDRTVRALSAGIDPDTLPPSFTVPRDEPVAASEDAPAPAPRRRARRKPAADDAGEPIQSLI